MNYQDVIMKKLLYLLLFSGLFSPRVSLAQNWLNGYSYRKKITVDKAKVLPVTTHTGSQTSLGDLTDFPLLIELVDRDLVHLPGTAGNKVLDAGGRDISFTLASGPAVPLSFQLENYDPATGKLTCWVNIPNLSASGTASSATAVYLYYGSELLHDSFADRAGAVWNGGFSRVWHMTRDAEPATCRNALGTAPQDLVGSVDMNGDNFLNAKVGKGAGLDGVSEFLTAEKDTAAAFTISGWIKPLAGGKEQVIMANDSVNAGFRNGYILKLNDAGKLVMEMYRSQTVTSLTGNAVLEPDKWYYLMATVAAGQVALRLNGKLVASSTNLRAALGGSLRIGSDKSGGRFFSGLLDEFRIQDNTKPVEWHTTQYVNQDDPLAFFSVSEEEYNPLEFFVFTGAVSELWQTAANWSNAVVPGNGSNVVISKNASARLPESAVTLNRLLLNPAAGLAISNALSVNGAIRTAAGSVISIEGQGNLKCLNDVINDGQIISDLPAQGTLVFSGNKPVQFLSGSGDVRIFRLENMQSGKENLLVLDAPLQVAGFVKLIKGGLDANGHLTLLSGAGTGSASLLPVPVADATISGTVVVQYDVSGSYPAPGSARNWRLLASPVYQGISGPLSTYDMAAYKQSMFVTGPGGASNGFDPSSLNNGTIYTHDQSLPGTLSQKYIAIHDINERVPLGKGVFVFSRGSRYVANAYASQVEQPPFSNPEGFCISYKGTVFTGDLVMELNNNNSGGDGDGFNLLGNPYPAALIWGNLDKTGLSPYVWMFDPLNNDYRVSDDPDTEIPSGCGFFVRVTQGQTAGRLVFSEDSKRSEAPFSPLSLTGDPVPEGPGKIKSRMTASSENAGVQDLSGCGFTATLDNGPYLASYKVSFRPGGNDGVDHNDAPKIGEGYLNLCSQVNGTRLSAERRNSLKQDCEIQLYTSVWGSGTYRICLRPDAALMKNAAITLTDHYLKKEIPVKDSLLSYYFKYDAADPDTKTDMRFSVKLAVQQQQDVLEHTPELTAYPNPLSGMLFFKSSYTVPKPVLLVFTDLLGRIADRRRLIITGNDTQIDCSNLPGGPYLLNIVAEDTLRIIRTIKLIKL